MPPEAQVPSYPSTCTDRHASRSQRKTIVQRRHVGQSACAKPPGMSQSTLTVDVIKQYAGVVTVQRHVKVKVPGKHFPNLTPPEQAVNYWGEAIEYAERHKFSAHAKAWGAAHTGPGIRFLCTSDAIDDPDHQGFWTTLFLYNRWRHETYKQFVT